MKRTKATEQVPVTEKRESIKKVSMARLVCTHHADVNQMCFINTELLKPELNCYLQHVAISLQINPGSMVNIMSLNLRNQLGSWAPTEGNHPPRRYQTNGVARDPSLQDIVINENENELVESTNRMLYMQGRGKLEVIGTFKLWCRFRDWGLDRQVTNFWTNQLDESHLIPSGDYVQLDEVYKLSVFYLVKEDVPFTLGQQGLKDYDLSVEYPRGCRSGRLRPTWVLRRDPLSLVWILKGRCEILHESEVNEADADSD